MQRRPSPQRALWYWYRAQRRTRQIVIGTCAILVVLLLSLSIGAIIINATRPTPHALNAEPTPTDTPTFSSGLPGTIPVTPLPTIIATPGAAPTTIPTTTATSGLTPTATSTGTITPTTTTTATATATQTPTVTATP